MRSLQMSGPFKLDAATIEKQVGQISAGNYAIGRKNGSGRFGVHYVGRADADLALRIKAWIGRTDRALFKFSYAASDNLAFAKQCRNYHDFSPRGNTGHPARAPGKQWKCPRCACFDD